jgi:hypothetical protein
MEQMLRIRSIQDIFAELGGTLIFADWLDINPDRSFPPPDVIESVLKILKVFPISSENLVGTNLV